MYLVKLNLRDLWFVLVKNNNACVCRAYYSHLAKQYGLLLFFLILLLFFLLLLLLLLFLLLELLSQLVQRYHVVRICSIEKG